MLNECFLFTILKHYLARVSLVVCLNIFLNCRKHPSDPFKVLATVDVTCTGMCDDENIESTIFNEIQTNTRLGSATVYPDKFRFKAYTGKFIF